MNFSISNWKIAEPFLQAYREGDRTALLALADKIEEDLGNPSLASRIRHLARHHNYTPGHGCRTSYSTGCGYSYSYSYDGSGSGCGYGYGSRIGYGPGPGPGPGHGYGYGYGYGARYGCGTGCGYVISHIN